MNTGAVSMRYARALLMFANDAGVTADVYQEALILRNSSRITPFNGKTRDESGEQT